MAIVRDDVVTKLIYDQLAAQIKRDMKGHYVSSIHAGKIAECPRRSGFLLYNLQEDSADPIGMIHMKMGIQWHEFIQSVLMATGRIKVVEEKQEKVSFIAGMMDAAMEEDGVLIPIEIKPLEKDKFMRIKEPNPIHVGQLQMYMFWKKAPYGRLIYYNKNISHWRTDTHKGMPFIEFKVEKDDALVASFRKMAEGVMAAYEANDLPPIPKEFGTAYCKYCFIGYRKCLLGMEYVERRLHKLGRKVGEKQTPPHRQKETPKKR